MSTTDAANELHADGKVLLAVAEGKTDQQPDEATLTHIFSCATCGATLEELRLGLSGLATGDAAAPRAAEVLESDPDLMMNELESYSVEDRAKSMIWKLAIVGGLLALGMLWLKSSAASLG